MATSSGHVAPVASPSSDHWYRFRSERSEPLGHRRELDGIRALAVGAVLLYHARVPWASGGFLGVTVFFTLSGFLITSLALREWLPSASFDIRSFLGRRFRRLLPAAWVTIGLVVAMGAAGVWTDGQLRDLRTDVPAALAQVLNWVYVAQGRSYGADMAAPSPLQHFWSLGIEEQFYLAFPIVLLGLLALSRRTRVHPGGGGRRRLSTARLASLLGALLVVSAGLCWWQGARSSDAAYFGTFSRGGEILVGALLACALLRRTSPISAAARRTMMGAGAIGLVVLVALLFGAAVFARWMYPWGFLVAAGASALLIAAAMQPGFLQRGLAWAPLAALGRISYGVYLLHWPIFLWLSPTRVGWSLWPLFALRMAVTVLSAIVMFRVVERPARTSVLLRRPVAAFGAAGVALALVVGSFAVGRGASAASPLESVAAAAGTEVTLPTQPPPLRVLLVGDELAAAGTSLSSPAPAAVSGQSPESAVEVTAASFPSCGLTVGGWVALSNGQVERDAVRCGDVRAAISERVERERPDVVLLWSVVRDTADRRYASDQDWGGPGDASIDGFQRSDLTELLDVVGATGARAAILTAPRRRGSLPAPPVMPTPRSIDPRVQREEQDKDTKMAEGVPAPRAAELDDARVAAWNATLRSVATLRGASVLDAAGAMAAWPGGEFDPQLRSPDGTGLTAEGTALLSAWLADSVRALVAAPPEMPDAAGSADDARLGSEELPPAPAAAPRRRVAPDREPTVLVVGDSVGFNYATGLSTQDRDGPPLSVHAGVRFGCPIARGGDRRFMREIAAFVDCDWSEDAPSLLATYRPDVVVIATGVWDVVDRRFPGEDRWRHIGDPQVDRHLLVELVSAIDTWGSGGATVVLATMPHIESGRDQGYSGLPESDPARMDRLNEVLREAAAQRPDVATVVDVAGWLAEQPGGDLDAAKRVDGVHYDTRYAPVVSGWLAEQLDLIARAA